MSHSDDSDVLSLLQPDLLTVEELISKIQSRCRIKNLGLMSKEGLVGLFRRVILPLPQRSYRANRRGKMLSSRRAKAGLENKRKEEGCSTKDSPRVSTSNNRLKPPPTASTPSHKIRLSSDRSEERNLDNIVINNRKKLCGDESRKESESGSSSGRKITLKRSIEEKISDSTPPAKSKKNVIKWP